MAGRVGAGLVAVVMGFVLTYLDLRGPEDARGDRTMPFLWVPGAVIIVIGVALFAWGWWRSARADESS